MRIKDVYNQFIASYISEARTDWDNGSGDWLYFDNISSPATPYQIWELERLMTHDLSDVESNAHKSFDECKEACLIQEKCLQFRYYNGICAMADKIKHGDPVKRDDGDDFQRIMSGWDINGIKRWIEAQGDCEQQPLSWPVMDVKG